MSFLNPILLAGLGAVSIPIIIHLLNRRRFQKVVWAAMRFLQTSVEKNQKRLRIEDMILLALRCLLMALLALALARPAWLSEAGGMFGQTKVTAVIIVDQSRSMGMSDGTATRLEKARRAAEQALDSMPSGSATAVFLASDVVKAVIPEPTFDLNLARKVVREAPLTDRGSDLFPALQQALDLLQGRLALRREIYLITDGQAAGWRQLTEIHRALEQARTEIRTHLVLVNEHEEKNLGVSELRLGSGLCPVGQPLRFEARVSNYGKEEARQARISLSVDGDAPSEEYSVDAIPPGSSKHVTLFAKLRAEGYHSVTARLAGDRLAADDQRSLAVRAIKELKVLLVDGEPGNEPRESEVFFLRNALVPVPPGQATDYFIQTAVVTAPEFAQARLDDFDAVVLANVPDLGETGTRSLESYLRRGGGLLVFPGARVNVKYYNDELFRRLRVLPAAFGELLGAADQEDTFVTLQEKNYEHSIVSLWNDPGAGRLASARFFRHYALLPEGAPEKLPAGAGAAEPPSAKAVGPAQVIVRYNDGSPAMVERSWGLGRVVQFSSTADTAWNDLPVRLAFVPLLHRAVGAVVARQDEELNVRVGEKLRRRVPADYLDKDAVIFRPRQGEVLRDLRRIELVNGWPTLQFEGTDLAGVYDAAVGDPALKLKFATQADAAESSLDELSDAQLSTLRDVATVVAWSPGVSLRGLVEKARTGVEFWLPLIVLCVILAGAEIFLAQWFSRSK